MIYYIPAASVEALSAGLYALSRPVGVRDARDSVYLFGWKTDTQKRKWIEVDDTLSVRVHKLAELNGIADILAPFIGHGLVQADIDGLESLVVQSRGEQLVVYDAFPQFFKDQAKTRQQMIDDGLLPSPTP